MSECTLTGGCLCGAVRYSAQGTPKYFYHCHCERCRKATGTGHATNLFLDPGVLTWVSGEELVRSFKVPEAQRFTNQFCATCGSRVPRQPAGSDRVMIPAGSLDTPAPMQPQARIFAGSRAAWSCGTDELPTYPEYAPV